MSLGSCFADVMGYFLHDFKFTTCVNPFGITYNPHSLHTQLLYAIHNQPAPDHTFLKNNGIHFNYNFHSELSGESMEVLSKKLQTIIGTSHYFLKDAQWLIITYGTAWTYVRKETGEIVANCHKMAGNLFEKDLFTQKKMIESFNELYSALKSFNKNINIILTVSPVRHIKDTLTLNTVSKSVLRLACHTLTEQHTDVHYFPAYEFVIDDLRDYRFYKPDMIHPSSEAEAYIWEKFKTCYFDKETLTFINAWEDIRKALLHKPFHPGSTSHLQFLKELVTRLESFKPLVNVDEEINFLQTQRIL